MSNPAPARIPRIVPLDLCLAAIELGGLEERIVPEQMKAGLGGLANFYGLHALSIGKEEFSVQTAGGFVSEILPREIALQQIANCTSVSDAETLAKILDSLELALQAEFAGKAQRAVEIPGFGTFVREDSKRDGFRLHFGFPG
ncbi:MAG: hypothetical protein U0Q16_36065 [Bryobacteraceae bacterium]